MKKIFLLLAALAVSAGAACKGGGGPTSPTEVWKPNTGSRATMSWEFWVGDPSCVTGCPPPAPQLLMKGGPGTFDITTKVRTVHLFQLRVNYPQEAGHRIKTIVWTDANSISDYNGGKPEVQVHEGESGNKTLGLDVSFNLGTRKSPGDYVLRVTVEETLPGGAVETLTAEIQLRVRAE